ncbi:MAG: glycosyltransferase family 4 protein [Chloroflexi bacterium]|nr:glycosyltransferase family 4 protein [Chloroflexota bacterium]
MKIALVSPYDYLYPGGVVKHISQLDKHFRQWGYEVRVIAPCSADEEYLPDHLIVASSRVIPVPYSGSIARVSLSPRLYFRVKRILKQERFDIVHAHEPLSPALPLAVLRHSKAVNIGTFHAYRESHAALDYTKPIARRFFARLDGRIVVSEPVREYLSKYFPTEYVVIPNGIDIESFQGAPPLPKYANGQLNILFVGRLEKRKGFSYLLDAFARVKAQVPQARLIVVGAFDKQDKAPYVRQVRRQRIRDVHFVGYVPDEELPRYYASAHLFCAPSTGFESFGLVLLEAMAAGVPVVASNIAGYQTLLSPGREGLAVPPADPVALGQAIIELLQDPDRRRWMGEQGRLKARGYSWENVAKQVLEYYQELFTRRAEHKEAV